MQIPHDFYGDARQTIAFDEPVVNLITPKSDNYYHWTAEGLSRWV